MQLVVPSTDIVGAEPVGPASDIGDLSAGFTHQQNTGGDIPGIEPVFPIAVVASRRDISEIQGGGTEPPHAGTSRHDATELIQKTFMPGAVLDTQERNTGGE